MFFSFFLRKMTLVLHSKCWRPWCDSFSNFAFPYFFTEGEIFIQRNNKKLNGNKFFFSWKSNFSGANAKNLQFHHEKLNKIFKFRLVQNHFRNLIPSQANVVITVLYKFFNEICSARTNQMSLSNENARVLCPKRFNANRSVISRLGKTVGFPTNR